MQFWIYKITHVPTGRIYIGHTSNRYPFARWAAHISDLTHGTSRCSILQSVWENSQQLTQWRFEVCDQVEGKRQANFREAERILEVPIHLRLNSNTTSTISTERLLQIRKMLAAGERYKVIAAAVGISMSMISKIKRGTSYV